MPVLRTSIRIVLLESCIYTRKLQTGPSLPYHFDCGFTPQAQVSLGLRLQANACRSIIEQGSLLSLLYQLITSVILIKLGARYVPVRGWRRWGAIARHETEELDTRMIQGGYCL